MELKSFKATGSTVAANPAGFNDFGYAEIDEIKAALGDPTTVSSCTDVPRGLSLLPSAPAAATCAAQTAKVERQGNNCQELRFF